MHDNLGPRNFRKPLREEEPFFDDAQDPYGEEERWWWIFQNPLGVIMMVALAIVLVIGLWFVFKAPSTQQGDAQNGVVVIKSDGTPYKEAPDESANQVVENQDKEVYKRLGQSQSEEQEAGASVAIVEEKPLDSNEFPETPKEEKKGLDQPNSLRKITEGVGVKMPTPVANEQFISEKKKPELSEEAENQIIEVPAPKKSADKPKANLKGLSAGSYVIRVASFRKQETADRELHRVVSALGKSLEGVGRVVKKIESDSGTFYVVTLGGFSSLAKAKQTIKLLKDKNFDAVVQKVGG
jgi:hypothetical protein